MSLSFAKAPLVEIIAELRWLPSGVSSPPPAVPFPSPFIPRQEEFFMRVGKELQNLGFKPERVVPPGFIPLLHQPVWRFTGQPEPSPVLYQVGVGIFSAHGLRPYRSWEYFSPNVQRGLVALLKARDEGKEERDISFSKVTLRYIDAFNQELAQDRDGTAFIREILKIPIAVPPALVNLVEHGSVPHFGLQIAMPVAGGLTMNLSLAEGRVGEKTAVIMDTIVSQDAGVVPNVEETMNVLHAAHQVIHTSFLGLTTPIRELMQPEEV